MQAALQTKDLSMAYGERTLFRDVNLQVARGETVALLGHNGTGKTTLLKILAGLIRPTKGSVDTEKGTTFAYVPEYFPRMNLTARQYIRHMGAIEGLTKDETDARAAALVDTLFLIGMLDTPMKHLSKGTLQKVGVVQALLCEHPILLLDEPLSGQDIDSQRAFIDEISRRKQAGLTVLLSCHEPFLVDRLADRVFEIQEAKLAPVSLDTIRVDRYDTLLFAMPKGETKLPDMPQGAIVRQDEGRVSITLPAGTADPLIVTLIQKGFRLLEMKHEDNL